jgi:hypothetical protein
MRVACDDGHIYCEYWYSSAPYSENNCIYGVLRSTSTNIEFSCKARKLSTVNNVGVQNTPSNAHIRLLFTEEEGGGRDNPRQMYIHKIDKDRITHTKFWPGVVLRYHATQY